MIKNNKYEEVKYLLNQGHNCDEESLGGKTPLVAAILEDNTKIVKLLLDFNVNTNVKYKYRTLNKLIKSDEMRDLLEKRKIMNESSTQYKTKIALLVLTCLIIIFLIIYITGFKKKRK